MTMWIDSSYDRLEAFLIETGFEDNEFALVLRFIKCDSEGNVLDSVTVETSVYSKDRSEFVDYICALSQLNLFHAQLLSAGSIYNKQGEKIDELNWNHLILMNYDAYGNEKNIH